MKQDIFCGFGELPSIVIDLLVVGGGPAGFMSAITASEAGLNSVLIESSSKCLQKVLVSGGGRCNVTNACWNPSDLVENYPRGEKELRGLFSKFSTGDTVDWFESRGLSLKVEKDERIFPESNSSSDVALCLLESAKKSGISVITNIIIKKIEKKKNLFYIYINEKTLISKRLIIATGSSSTGYKLAQMLGHQIIKPLPSLFSFKVKEKDLVNCKGISVQDVNLKLIINNNYYSEIGPLLITHWGFSGPAILKLSSFAAIELASCNYNAELIVNWVNSNSNLVLDQLKYMRIKYSKASLYSSKPFEKIAKNLWNAFLQDIKVPNLRTWSDLLVEEEKFIVNKLIKSRYCIKGKGPFGDEFVTAGGIDLRSITCRDMGSIKCKGLFFAGEVLNIDGLTGGFNFQNCWTTGWVAGKGVVNSFK